MAGNNQATGMLSEMILPDALKSLIADMPEDQKAAFIDFYMENMVMNTDTANQPAPLPESTLVKPTKIEAKF